MKPNAKLSLLGLLTVAGFASLFLLHAVPQDPAYHHFADTRARWGIPNVLNVLSNIPFLFTGLVGIRLVHSSAVDSITRRCYYILFGAIVLTGIGSGYYHWAPANSTLVFDRLPMVIVFMSFLAATITEWISPRLGAVLLSPLLLAGLASLAWWYNSELHGAGDLRFYGFVQFYPMIAVPVIMLLYNAPGRGKGLRLLLWVITWYLVAKAAEHYDAPIYRATGVSGHTIKHLVAALATWYITRFFKARHGAGEKL